MSDVPHSNTSYSSAPEAALIIYNQTKAVLSLLAKYNKHPVQDQGLQPRI